MKPRNVHQPRLVPSSLQMISCLLLFITSLILTPETSSALSMINNDQNTILTTTSSSSRRDLLLKSGSGMIAAVLGTASGSGSSIVGLQPALAAAAAELEDEESTLVLVKTGGPIRYGDESIMSPKAHGTSSQPVQGDLLWGVNNELADRITSYNRRYAEVSGYFMRSTNFKTTLLKESATTGPITFYDSVTGKPLFVAPINRSLDQFLRESELHGWPSFRDDEVVWDNVRVLQESGGETVSVDGSHLGHNIPDSKGNRYCINLVSVAGRPTTTIQKPSGN